MPGARPPAIPAMSSPPRWSRSSLGAGSRPTAGTPPSWPITFAPETSPSSTSPTRKVRPSGTLIDRDDAKIAERVTRHQLSKFLLRHGRIYPKKTAWNPAHMAWIAEQGFDLPAQRQVLADYREAVELAWRPGRSADGPDGYGLRDLGESAAGESPTSAAGG